MTNVECRQGVFRQHRVRASGGYVEVLPYDGDTMYLGIGFVSDIHDREIGHRISRGWAAFGMYMTELTNTHYPLKYRLRLFSAVVAPTVLYGSGCWTMTAEREHRLRVEPK
eukprot:4535472-Pyramimonas_sp.AAC.1